MCTRKYMMHIYDAMYVFIYVCFINVNASYLVVKCKQIGLKVRCTLCLFKYVACMSIICVYICVSKVQNKRRCLHTNKLSNVDGDIRVCYIIVSLIYFYIQYIQANNQRRPTLSKNRKYSYILQTNYSTRKVQKCRNKEGDLQNK